MGDFEKRKKPSGQIVVRDDHMTDIGQATNTIFNFYDELTREICIESSVATGATMGMVELKLEQNRLHEIFEIDNRDKAGMYEIIEIAKRKSSISQTNSLLMLNINSTRETVKQAL